MIKEALSFIIEGHKAPEMFEADGVKYLTKSAPKVDYNHADTLKVNTLQAIVDYLKAGEGDLETYYIHVVDHATVKLISTLHESDKVRDVIMKASIDIYDSGFKFGKKYDREDFIIEVMSKFVSTEERANVLQVAGKLKAEKVKEATDDGISQTVAQKAGALIDKTTVKNPVELRPFRTFREVEQPASNFVFRFHQDYDGDLPRMALYEADGSAWKLEAITAIKKFFEGVKELKDITILA